MRMRSFSFAASVILALALSAGVAAAETPTCSKLDGEKKALAGQLLEGQYCYDCCDDTIARCLKEDKVCRLAWRLSEDICRRVADGQDRQTIERALSRRARSMMASGKKASIALEGFAAVGAESAPVTVVEYACARCPYCSKLTPSLHAAIASGDLVGKVKMVFKPFPIKGHEYSKEGGLAFMAGSRMGKGWEYILHAYDQYDAFALDRLPRWADEIGLDQPAFLRTMDESETRKLLVASKREGLRNGVDATPTIFINGRKYVGDLAIEALVDTLEEEVDRVQGRTHR